MSPAYRFGQAIGRMLEPLIGDKLRARFAAEFGVCRGCGAALAGPSPEQVCEPCHADEVLRMALGGDAIDSLDMLHRRAGGDA